MRAPSPETYRRLLVLGNGCVVITPGKRDWQPLLRRGWVEVAWSSSREHREFLPPLQITAAGLRALADWVEREGGLPAIQKPKDRAA